MTDKHVQPPQLAQRILQWYCRNAMIEDLEGDLDELFEKDVQKLSPAQAKMNYCRHVISLILSYAIRKRKKDNAYSRYVTTTLNISMLKNYFIIASRNLAKHKFFTIINVLGLAVGMSISLLVIAMLSFVSTYDNFHKKKDRIYRVISYTNDQQRNIEYASAPSQLARHLEHISGVENLVRVNANFSTDVSYHEKELHVNGYFADPSFLNLFTFPLLKGNAATALNKPFTVIITEAYAKKLFRDEDPIGKVLHTEHFGDFEITGILQDVPKNSHMQFEGIASYETLENFRASEIEGSWSSFRNSYLYFQITSGENIAKIEDQLNKAATETYRDPSFKVAFHLQALRDIVPGMELSNQIGPEWGYIGFSIFGLLTLLILLPACFNYANISISRALKRMKEIGLRKVLGGQQNQIFFQFITETVIVTMVALVLSYFLFILVKTEFLALLVDSSALELDPDVKTVGLFITFALIVGIGAGIVPAMYFARLNPVQALKSKFNSRSSRFSLRKFLTVAQFALSLGFIMGVIIILGQYRKILSYDFGFKKGNILNVHLNKVDPEIFRNEFSQLPAVTSISMSSGAIGTSGISTLWINDSNNVDSIEVNQMYIDEFFVTNHGLKILSGENFNTSGSTNKQYVIVNEQFATRYGDKDTGSIIGKTFTANDTMLLTVKAVVKDFHYAHLTEPIKPFFFRYDPSQYQIANVSISSGEDIFTTISKMEALWKKLEPHEKFEAKFLADEINDAYDFYFSMIKICGYLGLLAITISCLGMLGMVVFTVENKIKEIGVRKVMGASTISITYILSRDFLKLLVIAAMISTPVTYLLFDQYLQRQYFKLNIGIAEILISLALVMGLGLAAILSQTWRAAQANPVDSLRSD